MNKKVLVVDYDRTLFINNSDMLNNINSINKFRENGNIFIIATGRTYNSLKKEIDNFESQQEDNDSDIDETYYDDKDVE